jgi:hypothetical protein
MAFYEFFGLFFDPKTGESFTKNDNDTFVITPFTFVPVYTNGMSVNPFQFATAETAQKLSDKLNTLLPEGWKTSIRENRFVGAPVVVRTEPERLIEITTAEGFKTSHNAGLIASSVIRIGWRTTVIQLIDEVAYAKRESSREED